MNDAGGLDTTAAEHAVEALEPQPRGIPAGQVPSHKLERKRAALLAWRVAREPKDDVIGKRLTALPKPEFASTRLAKLEPTGARSRNPPPTTS